MQSIIDKLLPHIRHHEEEKESEFCEKKGLPGKKISRRPENERLQESARCFNRRGVAESNSNAAGETLPTNGNANSDETYHNSSADDKRCLSICLRAKSSSNLPDLERRYILCSANTPIKTVNKFLAKKLYGDVTRAEEVGFVFIEGIEAFRFPPQFQLSCNNRQINESSSLKHISSSVWKFLVRLHSE